MRALVFEGPGQTAIRDCPTPLPADDEILLEVLASGICGSELEAYAGSSTRRVPPLVLGHEFVGRDPRDGAFYVVNPLTTCGRCDRCAEGETNLCSQRSLLSLDRHGGNAALVAIARKKLIPWNDASPILGALAEPAATALHALITQGGVTGKRVAVVGCGAMGLLAILLAGALEAAQVYAFDPLQSRQQLAEEFGALPIDEAHADVDVVIDTVGTETARQSAVSLARAGGSIRLVGLRHGASSLDFGAIVAKGLTLTGIYAYTDAQLREATKLIEGLPEALKFVHVMPFDRGAEAFAMAHGKPNEYVKVVLNELK